MISSSILADKSYAKGATSFSMSSSSVSEIVRTLPLVASSKDAPDDGPPHLMGREPPQERRDTELKMLSRTIQAQEFEGWPTDGFTTVLGHL